MGSETEDSGGSSVDFELLGNNRARLPKFFAIGNVAVGFIAIGNVAVGFIAIGASLAIGPIAIGMNSVGWVLALGLNAAGTLCGALINGVGVFGAAGVNGIGTYFDAFVNQGQSIVMAILGMLIQGGLALKMSLGKTSPGETKIQEPKVSLIDLVRGSIDRGKVEASLILFGGTFIRIADHNHIEAELTLPGTPLPSVEAARRLSPEQRTPMIFTVRAAQEPVFDAPNTDYRAAPPTSRVLYVDDAEFLPVPEPFWARPGALRTLTIWTLWLGALISAVAVGMRILL